jgi:DUF438 domain-containing protein
MLSRALSEVRRRMEECHGPTVAKVGALLRGLHGQSTS